MPSYTVKQVAEMVGVAPTTLRAWERRYHVVEPRRTTSRYRIYSDTDVARLRHMVALTARGVPASLAASQVTAPPAADLDVAPGAFVRAAQTLDATRIDALLDGALSAAPFEEALEARLIPALNYVGEAWHDGELSVASEHLISEAVARRLAAAFESARPRPDGPAVAVGLPPGSFHQLGALATATCLRRRGLPVRYLGANVPIESWQQAAALAEACVIAVPTEEDARATTTLVTSLDGSRLRTRVYLGGPGATMVEPSPRVVVLTETVTAGADRVVADLSEAASPS